MKTFFKKFFVFAAILAAAFSVTNLSPAPVHAADPLGSCRNFLGLTSWDCGISGDIQDTDQLTSNVVLIAVNVLTDLAVIAAYLVLAYTIYGGYLYIFSSGDPGKAASGKKTLTRAFIGLAIVGLANVILNSIRIGFLGANGSFSNCLDRTCIDANQFVTNTIGWFIGIAGTIAAIFIVVGGVGYVTSGGDPGKVKKSKDTLRYALIGLLIVGLAQLITAFVSNIVREADQTVYINETIISKEYHEK